MFCCLFVLKIICCSLRCVYKNNHKKQYILYAKSRKSICVKMHNLSFCIIKSGRNHDMKKQGLSG